MENKTEPEDNLKKNAKGVQIIDREAEKMSASEIDWLNLIAEIIVNHVLNSD